MKLDSRRIEAFLANPDPAIAVVLVFGPDRGLVAERLARLLARAVTDPNDPFAVTRIEAVELERAPARLAEEAQAYALGGGRRAVVVRDASDRIARALALLLEIPQPAAFVLLEAGDLPASSKLRQAIERARQAVALPCYREEGAALVRAIAGLLRQHRLEADPEVLERLAAHVGADRALTRNEIDKLAVYIGDRPERRVRLEDVEAVVADAAPLAMEAAVDAVLAGRPLEVARHLDRLFAEGEAPVAILRRTAHDVRRLLDLATAVASGIDPRQAVEAAHPPIFYRRRPMFEAALRRWSPRLLVEALTRLQEAERLCKTTGLPDRTICGQQLVAIAGLVRSATTD
ncbi:hypothetical protein HRbin40_00565 [bacterium HR40]|nr:hypothetical protein HRbin40_00565 [bacterium HR40]